MIINFQIRIDMQCIVRIDFELFLIFTFNPYNIEPDATLTHVQLIIHVEKEHNVKIPEDDQYVHALLDMQAIHTLDVFEVI